MTENKKTGTAEMAVPNTKKTRATRGKYNTWNKKRSGGQRYGQAPQ